MIFLTRKPNSLLLLRVFARFADAEPELRLERIRVEETNNNAFDYLGEGHLHPR